MPEDLMEHMYCSQQINIPPNLPYILKQYAKAAIRTQPYDLLYWSAAYFRAKANDTPPPVKDRLEYPPVDSPSRLSPGFLKVLHKQLGENIDVSPDILYEKWLGVCLVKSALDSLLKVGSFYGAVPWLKFVAIAAGHICPSLSRTMVLICETLTEEPEGGSAMIPVETFVELYEWLAQLDCGPEPPRPDIPPSSILTERSELEVASNISCSKESESTNVATGVGVTEKDSTAGLMVWPDVCPEVKPERISSPKHTDEPGASSELGIEVLDDAKGVVTDVLTIYPVQSAETSREKVKTKHTSVQPEVGQSHLAHDTQPEVGSNILSHSSLRENDDWIKIPSYQPANESIITTSESLGEVQRKSAASLKIEEIENEVIATEESKEEEEPKYEVLEAESKTTTLPNQEGVEDTQQAAEEQEVSQSIGGVESSEKTVKSAPSTLKSASSMVKSASSMAKSAQSTRKSAQSMQEEKLIGADQPNPSAEELQEIEVDVKSMESADSLLGPGESITVQQFVRDDLDGSTVTYSTVEIRRDVIGEKSDEKVERTTSEGMVQAARTQHRIADHESEEEMEQETLDGKPAVDKKSSEGSSFTVLPEEEPWQHIPGIGPVIPKQQVLAVVEYLQYWAAKQHGMVMPRNITHILCPPLDLPPSTASDQSHEQEY